MVVLGLDTQLVQIFGPTTIITLYLAYEIRYGRVNEFQKTLTALSGTILALSKHVDGVDASKVAGSLPERVVTTHDFYTERSSFGDDLSSDDDFDKLVARVDEYMKQQENNKTDEDEGEEI